MSNKGNFKVILMNNMYEECCGINVLMNYNVMVYLWFFREILQDSRLYLSSPQFAISE